MPRFSVIMACYNAEDTLPQTIASLQAQTEGNWEAIIVDDGSTDRTCEILRETARHDPRFRIIGQSNAGPSHARNVAVEFAKSRWIAFLDADDIWVPEKLRHVDATIADNPDTAAVYGQIAFFDPTTGLNTTTSTVRDGATPLSDLLGENPVCTLSNLCVRRDAFHSVGGFREDMRYSEDLEFVIRLVAADKILTGTSTLLVRYRASYDGLSANLMQMHQGWRTAVKSAGSTVTPRDIARAEALHLRYLARRALRLNVAPTVALRLALRGFCKAPVAFLGDGHRGPATFLACMVATLIPAALRRNLFA